MRVFHVIILAAIISCEAECQDIAQQGIRMMFWNVENAFDTSDDPLTDDNDFLPAGIMRWNETRYRKKINDIYKTIAAAGEWNPPDIVAFCEVENRKVLLDILHDTPLSRYEYGIIHEDSPDERGIDVCLIYRKDRIENTGYRYIVPDGISRDQLGSRTVLYSKLRSGNDTIHLFVNHWPSRSGGVMAEEELRQRLATTVKRIADSVIQASKGKAKILYSGDFNCTPSDRVIQILMMRDLNTGPVNLSTRFASEGTGTYRYRGTWEMIDQVIVSDYLMNCNEGLYADKKSMKIFSPFFLLTKDPDYPGLAPFSMYRGRRYKGGISDHLPVLIDLYAWPQVLQE